MTVIPDDLTLEEYIGVLKAESSTQLAKIRQKGQCMIKPMNNHCLIEVIDEYEGVVGSGGQQMQKGVLRDVAVTGMHLTASTGLVWTPELTRTISTELKYLVGQTVYWEEYSDMGKQFDIEGKKYVLIAFYRIIGFEE